MYTYVLLADNLNVPNKNKIKLYNAIRNMNLQINISEAKVVLFYWKNGINCKLYVHGVKLI